MKFAAIGILALAVSPVSAAFRPHPRVEVTPARLDQLRELRQRHDPTITRQRTPAIFIGT